MEYYKPILPSSLLEETTNQFNALHTAFNNFSLKTGVIIKSYEIDDEENITKILTEYDVLAIEQQGDKGTAPVIFRKCIALQGFGGVADFYEYRLTPSSKDEIKSDGEIDKCDGSIVLLLCLNGSEDKGIIVGFLKHPSRDTTITEESGKHLEGEFNGVNWQINDDGELTVTFKSPSSIENQEVTYADEEAGGTFLKIDKTGSFEIDDDNGQKIKIDKTEQTISVNSVGDTSFTTDANFKITAAENMEIECMDLLLQAEGKADLTIKKDMNLEIDGSFKGKAKKWNIESDSMIDIKTKQFMLDGAMTTISSAQVIIKGAMVTVDSSLIMLGNGGTPAVTMSTQFMGTGNVGIPVISSAIGPFSSAVFIAS